MTDVTIGIVGLGNMGNSMARYFTEEGFSVTGFDIDDNALSEAEAFGVTPQDSPAAVGRSVDVLITSLPNPPIVESAYTSDDGILTEPAPGLTAIDMSTIDPGTSRDIASAAEEVGVDFIDSPVSGGPEACRNGTQTMMLGGDSDVINSDDAQAVIQSLGKEIYHLGPNGSGHAAKMVVNIIALGKLLVSAEGMAFGKAQGLDMEVLMNVINNSGAASNQTRKRLPRFLNRSFEAQFSVDIALKDLELIRQTSGDEGFPLMVGGLVQELYREASAQGWGEEDIAAIVKVFEQNINEKIEVDKEIDESFAGYSSW